MMQRVDCEKKKNPELSHFIIIIIIIKKGERKSVTKFIKEKKM